MYKMILSDNNDTNNSQFIDIMNEWYLLTINIYSLFDLFDLCLLHVFLVFVFFVVFFVFVILSKFFFVV